MMNTTSLNDPKIALDLGFIRTTLMRMEDSIIFSLVERAQYKRNSAIYKPECDQLGTSMLQELKSVGSNGCLGDWFIYQTECLHSQVRRYLHPTEFAFFWSLPEPTLETDGQRDSTEILASIPQSALVNQKLLEIFRTKIVPQICEEGDDGNHGSTAVQDVSCLQLMATRMYFGLYVAESKFRTERKVAEELIKAGDREGLTAFITKPEVEARNVQRVILKARTFSQDIVAAGAGQMIPEWTDKTTCKIEPEFVGTVFRDYIMPLTREIEVEYLLHRTLKKQRV